MGAAAMRRDLYLQIGGSADGLTGAAKAGKTALLNLVGTADDVVAEVEKAFDKLGSGSIDASAKSMERSFTRTLAAIRTNAQKAMEAPTPAAATQILNVAGAEQAAASAEKEATALRVLADAASAMAQRLGDAGQAERVLAVGLATQAVEARNAAAALRQQATILGSVADEAGIARHHEDELSESHGRMGVAGMEAQHVVRSLSDSIAAGQSPMRALMMEMGRITEATTLWAAQSGATTGKLAALAGFLGGPWGMAFSIGAAVLTPMIGKFFETDDAAKKAMEGLREFENKELDLPSLVDKTTGKLKDQTEALHNLASAARAVLPGRIGDAEEEAKEARNDAFIAAKAQVKAGGRSRAGPNDAELNRAVLASGGSAKALNDALQAMLPHRSDLAGLARTVADAYAREELAGQRAGELRGQQAALGIVGHGGTVLTPELAKSQARDASATTAVDKAQIRVRDAEDRIDELGRMPVSTKQQAQMRTAEAALETATRALKAAQHVGHDDQQAGRHVTLAQAEGIVQGIGGRVTSAQRSTATQQVLYDRYMAYKAGTGPWAPLAAKPGTSEHERGQALDIAKGGGMSLARIVQAFRAQGVHLTERLDEGDHFHVAWGAKGGKGASPEALERRQQAAENRETRDQEAYAQLLGHAREETLQLQRQQVLDYHQAADLDVQQIEAERDRLDSAARAGAAEKKWSEAQAEALVAQYAINAALKSEAVRRSEMSKTIQEMFVQSQEARDARDQLLQIDLDMANTRTERLGIERRLLADKQQSRYEALDRVAQDPSASKDDHDRAERGMAALPALNAAESRQLEGRYQSPMDGYRDELRKSVGDMGEALQGVEVDGVKGLEDGLTGILARTKSVAQGFRDMAMSIIADLEKIAIEKAIFAFLGLSTGGKVPGFAGGGLPGFAGGGDPSVDNGLISGPGTGTSDSILAMVGRKPIRLSAGEGIVNARGVQKHWPLIDAINKDRLPAFATGGLVDPSAIFMHPLPAAGSLTRAAPVQIVKVVTEASPYFDTRVVQTTAPMAQAAMAGGASMAKQDLADEQYARIP